MASNPHNFVNITAPNEHQLGLPSEPHNFDNVAIPNENQLGFGMLNNVFGGLGGQGRVNLERGHKQNVRLHCHSYKLNSYASFDS